MTWYIVDKVNWKNYYISKGGWENQGWVKMLSSTIKQRNACNACIQSFVWSLNADDYLNSHMIWKWQLGLDEMLIIHFYERTDKMRLIYADYNPQTNSIDVTTFENYILWIDCNKVEDGLRTTPCSQNSLNALAIDEPLEYVRLSLDDEMQAWVDAIDSLDVW